MANKKVKKTPKPKETKEAPTYLPNQPWISMRTGLIIITITSIGMAVLTAMQTIPTKGTVQGILWGLLFGALIWAIFWGFYFFRRLIGPKG